MNTKENASDNLKLDSNINFASEKPETLSKSSSNNAKDSLKVSEDTQEHFEPKCLLGNYAKNESFIISRADKCSIYDTNENKYLDMCAGICVKNLGENPSGWVEMISKTASQVMHVGNYFFNKNEIKLASLLKELVKESVPEGKVFFCNSGTEANEAAIKFAILQNFSILKKEGKILAFSGGFHGRSLGSLSCTYAKNYREPFVSYMGINQVLFWDFNKAEGLEDFIAENNVNIVISEPIQGEGGVVPMQSEFAEVLKKLHSQKKFLWIIDEIQVGMGRTGALFSHSAYNIKPDFVTLAKALGNGVPIGAVICNRECVVTPGQHGTTFGGNPFATGVAYWVIKKIIKDNLMQKALDLGDYLKSELNIIKKILDEKSAAAEFGQKAIKLEQVEEEKHKKIVEIRGQGLLIGVQFHEKFPVADLLKKLFNERVLSISAWNNTLRICPPLVISKGEIDVFLSALRKCLDIENIEINKNKYKLKAKNEGKTIVWKISGDIDERNLTSLLLKFNKFLDAGHRIALVFGAGTAINEQLKNQNIAVEYIDGQRKTSLEVIEVLKTVVEAQKHKLINAANKILSKKHKKICAVEKPIFTSSTDLKDTHGYVLEPEKADVSEILKIWESKANQQLTANDDSDHANNPAIALVSFLAQKENQIYNANADICASCLAIELKADWIGFSVGHEDDIKKISEKNVALEEVLSRMDKKPFFFTEGFKMKLREIEKIFSIMHKREIKCYIGKDSADIPENYSDLPKTGVWIRKRTKYNVGLIGSRGLIGAEIVKYIKQNPNFNLYRFSMNSSENNVNQGTATTALQADLHSTNKESNSLINTNNHTEENIRDNPNLNDINIENITFDNENKKMYSFNYLKNPNQLDSPLNKGKKPISFEINPDKVLTKLNSWSDLKQRKDIDLWISACPNNILKNNINFIDPEVPIIDVSSDFRHHEGWEYAMCYTNDYLSNHRISNPGCYSSAVISALYPLSKIKEILKKLGEKVNAEFEANQLFKNENENANSNINKILVEDDGNDAENKLKNHNEIQNKNLQELMKELEHLEFETNITGISSHSGAGKDYLLKFPSLHETIIPYQPLSHSQQEEMQKFLGIEVNFVPMVTDQFPRGIICSLQIKCRNNENFTFDFEKIKRIYSKIYENNEFITCVWDANNVITTNSVSDTTNIILSNFALSLDKKILHIQSTIDNLTIGGGFSTYVNLCKYFGVSHKQSSYPSKTPTVPIESFESYEAYLNSLNFPLGFKAATTNVPFHAQEINRKKVLQFSCIRLELPGKWSAVYTRNPICGHPVTIGRELLKARKPIKAIWINNKIANVGSSYGLNDAKEISSTLANKLQCDNDQIVPLSTGIIGWRLPKNEIISASSHVVKGSITAAEAARAIMTTDSYPKAYVEKLSNGAEILGIAKGAGMIEPNMGTCIIILMTDAAQEQEYMDKALKACCDETFNCISIDADTSTSDAALLVSSCLKSQVDNEEFSEALMKVCKFLARQIVWNGEGVQHVIEVKIKNSPNKNLAKLIGKNIVNSPLTKSAICGNDPNVGRIIGSMAREVNGIDWSVVNVKLGEQFIYKNGSIMEWNSQIESELTEYLKNCQLYETDTKPAYPVHDNAVVIEVDLNQGDAEATVIGGDLTIDYVKINGNYRS